ncbi:large conductance mechanosensitive channel protein MscL [Deinococcus xianganensis]|uniref:Large-conductance mechanosensitive channel n=1 Tax=Deinococcus xianganensis TaxID=1507289 RepID=A0A6I4YID2_9DEIO|nr:large conductance mechanosensitive channel protein MscL [Deinococcus xianganensis]MXV20310.1 large conductance mechanosensitive channel protein MscL [Deinococcus xianganensis]
MLSGFRDFIMRGNIVDLAIAVATGAAFTALVGAFSTAFINPLIKLATGGGAVGGKFVINGVEFDYGLFITALITFLITMLVLYVVVVTPYNRFRDRLAKPAAPVVVEPTAQEKLLAEIRDELRRRP